MKGITSGNAYALADYGRMADIGVLQSVDANGLQTGLKDMSGFLRFAQQNVLRMPELSGAQTLSGLGMSFNYTSQDELLNNGLWGYQADYMNQSNTLQAQSLGLQFAGLASQKQYLWGMGDALDPSKNSAWGIENRINNIQWSSQLSDFAYQQTTMDLRHQYQQQSDENQQARMNLSNENTRWMQGFDYQTSLMRREWSSEDYQYSTQMRSLQFGWNMEDLDEQIRRSSGYERAMLIKQRDRATLSNNLESQQADKQYDRQEELWAREDERYKKSTDYNEQMIKLDEERFDQSKQENEQLYQLSRAHLEEEMQSATKLHALRMEMDQLQRSRQAEESAALGNLTGTPAPDAAAAERVPEQHAHHQQHADRDGSLPQKDHFLLASLLENAE